MSPKSISPIVPMDVSITRVAITKPEDAGTVEGEGDVTKTKVTEMGRKALVPYGLYLAHGFFSAPFAARTKASAEDLALFWEALRMMWDHDHSAARGLMGCRGLYVFSHANALGMAPAQELFDRVRVQCAPGVTAPRSFSDYLVEINEANLPEGVALSVLAGKAPAAV